MTDRTFIEKIPFIDENDKHHLADLIYAPDFSGGFAISYDDDRSTMSIEHYFIGVIWIGHGRYSHCQANPQLTIALPKIIAKFKIKYPELFI